MPPLDPATRRAMRRTPFFSKRGVTATGTCLVPRTTYVRPELRVCVGHNTTAFRHFGGAALWLDGTSAPFASDGMIAPHGLCISGITSPLYGPIAHTAQGQPNDAAMGPHNSRLWVCLVGWVLSDSPSLLMQADLSLVKLGFCYVFDSPDLLR
jgi:hypothetical protein